jgi:CheY-like chemotaxis protein
MSDAVGVLLIEDDVHVRHVVAEALADEGYAVREAADGRAALEQLATWRPDVILLDLMMPGLDGRAFRAEQRARGLAADAPLVVLSASRHVAEAGAAPRRPAGGRPPGGRPRREPDRALVSPPASPSPRRRRGHGRAAARPRRRRWDDQTVTPARGTGLASGDHTTAAWPRG